MIPGGAKGAETISKHPGIQRIINRFMESKNSVFVGMICAGTFVTIIANNPGVDW